MTFKGLGISYVGSKRKLIPTLLEVFRSLGLNQNSRFGDLFSGTGAVGYAVAKQFGCKVHVNDNLESAYYLARAKVTRYSKRQQRMISAKVSEYNQLRGSRGPSRARLHHPSGNTLPVKMP